jgi:predicted  nucleic acid-binding Zn-ribbon protein
MPLILTAVGENPGPDRKTNGGHILLPDLRKLVDLQDVDKAILEITQTLDKFPQELRAGEGALEELKAELAVLLEKLENLKRQRRDTEAETADMEDGIKKSRQRLMEIKSNIEYKAMLKEIAFKEDQRDQKETRILELMELIEAQKQALAFLEKEIQEREDHLSQQRLRIGAQTKKLHQELSSLQDQQLKARKDIPAALLKRYEFIRQRRNCTAITPVRDGVCLGCNMNILPQQFIDLQKGGEIIQCPHCQRILYWVGDEAEAQEAVS